MATNKQKACQSVLFSSSRTSAETLFDASAIQYYHSIDAEGRKVTIGKLTCSGTFGVKEAFNSIEDNFPVFLLLNDPGDIEFIARATCSLEDEYDQSIGMSLVVDRLYEKYLGAQAAYKDTIAITLETVASSLKN